MEGRLLSGSDDGLVCYWDLKGAGQTVEATQKFGERIERASERASKKSKLLGVLGVCDILVYIYMDVDIGTGVSGPQGGCSRICCVMRLIRSILSRGWWLNGYCSHQITTV